MVAASIAANTIFSAAYFQGFGVLILPIERTFGWDRTRNYSNVIVFCMEGGCRNNVGDWPTRTIRAADPGRRDFAYFSTKDRVMVEEADYGLMLWDGKNRGTLTNVVDLVRQVRPVVVLRGPGEGVRNAA